MRIVTIFFLLVAHLSTAQVIEAETGTLSGTQLSTSRVGYSGTGFVTGFDADGDKVTITVTTSGGIYNLYARYASPSGDKFNFVHVNGQNIGSVAFPSSTSFKETLLGKMYLKQGTNTIAIVKEWGYFDLDNIRLEAATPSNYKNIAANLVNPAASFKTDSLYKFLSKIYGKVILSGQYGGNSELNRISNLSGKTPAMRGFDLIEYSPTRVAHGSSSTEVERAIEWDKQKGITTFCWHWNAPKDLINQPGKEWWRGFYTTATTFDVTKAMNNQASEEYTLILHDIDAIAVQLKRLQAANIPVLWRPLHEAEGQWFWWGAKGPEPCKWLWKLLYDRLTNHHQINNLVWVWTSTGNPTALQWYPGDEYVDVIGADIYLPAGTYSSSFVTFDNMVALYEGKKIIALSENGPIPDAESLFVEGAAWSWFCTWSGEFIMDGVSNSTTHVNSVYNHDYVVTLDERQNVDAIITALEKKRTEQNQPPVVSIEDPASHGIYFKNPVTGNNLEVTFREQTKKVNVSLYNLLGEVEFQSTNLHCTGGCRLQIDLKDKNPGLYLMQITTPEKTQVFRIIRK
jgi:mannan endo-1,4-beta-mannosidase